MKKATEILEQMKQNNADANRLDEYVKNAPYDAQKIADAARRAELLRVENKILRDNARRAIAAETLPVVVEVLSKYDGKPYGEKTKGKIADEVFSRTGCRVYLSQSRYGSPCIAIYPHAYGVGWGNTEISLYTRYADGQRKPLFIGNKIHALPAEEFVLADCADYVEDPADYAELIMAEFAKLKQAQEAFQHACDAFNDLLPSGIEHRYFTNFRTWLL